MCELSIIQVFSAANCASKVAKEDAYFSDVKKRSLLMLGAVMLIHALSFAIGLRHVKKAVPSFTGRQAIEYLNNRGTLQYDTFYIKALMLNFAFNLLLSALVSQHPVISGSKMLRRLLLDRQYGVKLGEGKEREILHAYLFPTGAYIDLGERTPKELVEDKSLWILLNKTVKQEDIISNPEKQREVWVKFGFELQRSYKLG